jgi:hypothetical protein
LKKLRKVLEMLKESEKKSEEEIRLIEKLKGCKRK